MRKRATLTGLVLLATGCAIQPDESPKAIPLDQRGDFSVETSGDEATGSSRIYLLTPSAPDEPQRLRAVPRDVPGDPSALLTSLLSGPNESEREAQLVSAIPNELELLSARTVGRVLTLDVTDAFSELTPEALRLAVAQIVNTAGELDGVQAVRIRVNNENRVWPLGDGELTDRPLTVYDYPGLVESSQPALPAVPSGARG